MLSARTTLGMRGKPGEGQVEEMMVELGSAALGVHTHMQKAVHSRAEVDGGEVGRKVGLGFAVLVYSPQTLQILRWS